MREFYSALRDAPPDDEDWYFPVKCAGCDNEVAMLDRDGIYHFFNVIGDDAY